VKVSAWRDNHRDELAAVRAQRTLEWRELRASMSSPRGKKP
jgi:hypothetical protein